MSTELNLAEVNITIVEAGYSVIVGDVTETVTKDECVLYEGTLYCTRAQYELLVKLIPDPN